MKFSNYVFHARGTDNLGDNVQVIAIDQIYRRMGIPSESILYIAKNALRTYRGEYAILPVSMPLLDYSEGGISGRFSEYIVPVFLGLTLVKDSLLPAEVDYYRRYEPIGCRDERTLRTMRHYGIAAYLHGCITATFPRRDAGGGARDKVFVVDAGEDLLSHVPAHLLKDAVFLTHSHSDVTDPKAMMQAYYDRYRAEARLMITSLLHCAVPCMAAGIPVILGQKRVSYRFGWLEKLLPIYDRDDFANIDWNPPAPEYEAHKTRLLDLTIERLWATHTRWSGVCDLSWFYEDRPRKDYVNDAFEPIRPLIDARFRQADGDLRYGIWGLTQISILAHDYISREYPRARLAHVYDAFRTLNFAGIESRHPDDLAQFPDEVVLVTSFAGQSMAEALFQRIAKDPADCLIWRPQR